MKIISPRRESTADVFSTSNLIGKKVMSSKGVDAGKIQDFYTDTKTINGVIIRYKRKDYFIDAVHIHEAAKDTVVLTIHPFYLLIGKEVYTTEGELLGNVVSVTRETNSNEVDSIIVRRKMWETKKALDSDKIQEAKETIIIDNN